MDRQTVFIWKNEQSKDLQKLKVKVDVKINNKNEKINMLIEKQYMKVK